METGGPGPAFGPLSASQTFKLQNVAPGSVLRRPKGAAGHRGHGALGAEAQRSPEATEPPSPGFAVIYGS